jgi:hypothetical protein
MAGDFAARYEHRALVLGASNGIEATQQHLTSTTRADEVRRTFARACG